MNRSFNVRCGLFVASLAVIWTLSHGASSDAQMPESKKASRVLVTNSESTVKEEFPWGWLCWLRSSKIENDAPMTFGVVEIGAGKTNPLHMHPNCEEYLYVLSGSCKHVVGDEIVVLKKGDMARIPKNTPHKAIVIGDEPLKAVILYDSGERRATMLEEGKE